MVTLGKTILVHVGGVKGIGIASRRQRRPLGWRWHDKVGIDGLADATEGAGDTGRGPARARGRLEGVSVGQASAWITSSGWYPACTRDRVLRKGARVAPGAAQIPPAWWNPRRRATGTRGSERL